MNAPRVCSAAPAAVAVSLLFAGIASAQSAGWSPNRSGSVGPSLNTAGMHSSAVRRTSYSDFETPAWQRAPSATTARSTQPVLTQRIPTTASAGRSRQTTHSAAQPQFTASASARRAGSGGYSEQKLLSDYNIRLAEGEKLVGPPKISEGGPVVGQPNSAAPQRMPAETIPVPDNDISGGALGSEMLQGHPQEGEIIYEGMPHQDGDVQLDPGMEFENGVIYGGNHGGCADGNCGGSCTDGFGLHDDWCDPSRCPECGLYGTHAFGCGHVARCLYNCLGFLFKEASLFAGTQAFKGPLDLGINGNFGFNEGFNLGGALVPFPRYGVGYQVGARWTQSDLSGSPFGSAAREQVFVTAGLFHRAYRGCGLQWGIAYDWLTDNYFAKSTIAQLRTEVSFLNARGHELGFLGNFGVKNDQVALAPGINLPVVPADMYTMFYRHTTRYGGQGRLWGGFTAQNLPIFGADFRVPMSNRCDLVGGFNYIMPDAGQNNGGVQDESWGLGMNIVFYFGRPREGIHNTPFRPLFNVADNGTMMLERQ